MKEISNSTKSNLIAFLCGVVVALFMYPPAPTVELDEMDMDRITWKVLDRMDENGYNVREAKDSLTQTSGFFGW